MIDNEVSFTSLCYITVDYEGRIWLNRLADVEDDILHTPFKSERTDNYFENRDRLYRNDGPTALGTVGIWEWTAVVYPAMWTKPIEENTIFVSDAHLKYAKPYALKTILDSL